MNDMTMNMAQDSAPTEAAAPVRKKLPPLQVLYQGTITGSKYALMLLGVMLSAVMLYRASGAPLPLLTRTPSLNPGWYLLDPAQPETLHRGDVVRWNFVPPQWLRQTHPDMKPYPYLKRIEGVPGDRVFWTGEELNVCDPLGECRKLGKMVAHDGAGNRFPQAQFPDVIPPDQYLLIADHPFSVDGRYLGLIPINAITGRAREWMVEKRDYVAIRAKADAWFAKHPIESFRKDANGANQTVVEPIFVPE